MHRYLQIILLVTFTILVQGCSDKTSTDSESSSSSDSMIVTSSSSSSIVSSLSSSSISSSSVTSSSSSTSSAPIVINGYTLPPEPDETLNNSTLLGIDSNNNGVRDDVEIYVLNKYKDHHKIVSEIALQSGRAYQMALGDPSKAKESREYMSAARDCNWYFQDDADYYGDPILIENEIMDNRFEDAQINTKERIKAYLQYNHNLSGGVYRLTPSSKAKAKCDFNTTKLLED